jgi:hypothetical protein
VTYLANQRTASKLKLEDMAGVVAAHDTVPLTAVFATSLPQREVAPRIPDDASLEGQQGLPLVRYAGGRTRTRSYMGSNSRELRGYKDKQQAGKSIMDYGHGSSW